MCLVLCPSRTQRMRILQTLAAVLFTISWLSGTAVAAPKPARGYDTWDGFGTNINETIVLAQAAALKSFDNAKYKFIVLDEGWSHDGTVRQWVLDEHALPIPNPMLFPSSAMDGTLTALASTLKTQYDLTLGVWLIRGVPSQAVKMNLKVKGTNYSIREIINPNRTCDWHDDVYALDMSHPGAQIYYNSMFATYRSWGLDYFKVDCIFGGNLAMSEIDGVAKALTLAGATEDTVLSLSPGFFANKSMADALPSFPGSLSYRITQDMYACWNLDQEHATIGTIAGSCVINTTRIVLQFTDSMKALPGTDEGKFPDGDMLPVGTFALWNYGKQSPLTAPMLRFAFGLWSLFKGPIILSGDLTKITEPGAKEVINNRWLPSIHQDGHLPRVISSNNVNHTGSGVGTLVWASTNPNIADGSYVGFFAFSENYQLNARVNITIPVAALPCSASCNVTQFYMASIWDDSVVTSLTDQSTTGKITVSVPVNDALIVVVEPQN